MTFTSYAQGGSFRPKSVTDYLPALKENQARQKRDEQVYFDQMRRNDQTRIEEAKRAGDGLMALGKFSGTLADVLAKEAEKKAEEDMNEGVAMAYEEAMFGPGTPERLALDAGEEQLKTDDGQIQMMAGAVLANNPENYQAANNVKNLSGWKKYGYATGLAQMAGQNYRSWMDEALRSDDTTQITINGETFTPSEADDPTKVQAAMGVLRRQYLAQAGVSGLSKPLLAKYAFEPMYKADAAIVGQARKDYAIAQSEIDAGEADNALFATKDLGTYLDALSTTVDANGRMRGYGGAWNEAMKRLENAVEVGLISEADLTAMEGQFQGDTGRTFGELHRTKFASLRRAIQDQEYDDWSRSQKFQKAEAEQFMDQAMNQLMSQEQITQADIDAIREQANELYPGVSTTRLDRMEGDMTVEAEAIEKQEQQAEHLANAGLLTPERLSKFHWTIQRQFADVARMQQDVNGYNIQMDSIEDDIKNIARVTSVSARSGTVNVAIANAQAILRQRIATNIATGSFSTPQAAAQQAYADLRQEIIEGSKTPGSQWYISDQAFGNQIPKASTKESAAVIREFEQNVNRTTATLEALGGATALNRTPNLLFTDRELEDMEEKFSRPGFVFPALATYWASRFGVDPLEIINAQRKASGMGPLEIPPAIETVRQGVNPDLQSLLHRYKAPERSARALGSMAKYEPSIVPNGYGDAVQSAAEANGIPPSILAGLIETESAWNPSAVSSAGAVGLGQFMPATAAEFGVNRRDPISSINGAARYLRYLMDYFGGDLDKAIYAYNGGMGNVERLGVGFDGPGGENYEYHGKVMRGAYKYGYGQLPVRAAFQS